MTKSNTEIQLEEIQESSDPHRDATSTDSALRYSAYANRIRQIFLAAQRYVAYTSDIGESFRPVAHPRLVTLGYGISWAYVLGDVSYETWRARLRQEGSYYPGLKPWDAKPPPNLQAAAQYDDFDWKVVGVKRALFQSIASMGLPALTIHSTVRYTAGLFKNATNATVRSMGPVGCGLAVVPLLPYIFDKPVEHGIDYLFDSFVPKAVKLE
ncbi:DEKNAAC102896 [Brettanomyces naardenensis]|uniref:Mitochondrial fission process protein 1 n=1 Tax=Brettanomyces naardenensis TaxID=13370 RepID=A0A448YM19_BRENA|nr:DEKNAAC102896 [Brettanomyces naardenensis]